MSSLLDLHIHTDVSPDGTVPLDQILRMAAQRGVSHCGGPGLTDSWRDDFLRRYRRGVFGFVTVRGKIVQRLVQPYRVVESLDVPKHA